MYERVVFKSLSKFFNESATQSFVKAPVAVVLICELELAMWRECKLLVT